MGFWLGFILGVVSVKDMVSLTPSSIDIGFLNTPLILRIASTDLAGGTSKSLLHSKDENILPCETVPYPEKI